MLGAEASAFTRELLPLGTAVTLERDVSEVDRFDRLLRYVYLPDGRMANEVIVEDGYAVLATFPPDVKHEARIRAAQTRAREAGRGLWGACVDTPTPAPTVVPTPAPQATTAPTPTQDPRVGCHPSYPTVCIPPPPPDLDCGEILFRRFAVVGADPHRFDGDSDGVGCESG